ncbi:MAG: hypothetical protein KatS3mg090_0875 [Patescibacteria group bacterium]|nr:MAG: hypothetical protein KatS3mg090_0875 [Patescibacteria group bacterium]
MSLNNILPTVTDKELTHLIKNLKNYKYFKQQTIKELKTYFPNSSFLFFDSARSSLKFLAETVLNKQSKIALQCFTCSAVIHPFLTSQVRPVYLSFDFDSFNFEIKHLLEKKSSEIKAVLIQYTFGITPKTLHKIISFCRKNNILIIEDLSHSFGNKVNKQFLGNLGDFAVISFGKDKVINCSTGGCLVINNQNYSRLLKEKFHYIPEITFQKKLQQFFYLFFMQFAKKYYGFKLTRGLIFLLQSIGLLQKSVSNREKQLKQEDIYRFNKYLFPLLYTQIKKLKSNSSERWQNTQYWNHIFSKNYNTSLLKFPISVRNKKEILKELQQKKIFLSTWYANLIDPADIDLSKYQINLDNFIKEKKFAEHIINLPTFNLSKQQASIIYSILKKYEGY